MQRRRATRARRSSGHCSGASPRRPPARSAPPLPRPGRPARNAPPRRSPSRGAAIVCSIFIASTTIIGWPCADRVARRTSTCTTRPGIGAVSRPALGSAPAGGASGSIASNSQLSPSKKTAMRRCVIQHAARCVARRRGSRRACRPARARRARHGAGRRAAAANDRDRSRSPTSACSVSPQRNRKSLRRRSRLSRHPSPAATTGLPQRQRRAAVIARQQPVERRGGEGELGRRRRRRQQRLAPALDKSGIDRAGGEIRHRRRSRRRKSEIGRDPEHRGVGQRAGAAARARPRGPRPRQ